MSPKTLKVLSILLTYPEAEMLAALDEMRTIILQEKQLRAENQQSLLLLIDSFQQQALLDLQSSYVDLFDRGRFLSLHIFEHIHGESRDRGQAMVDLLQMYEAHGFELAARELPDYIPLFLEFLAQQQQEQAIQWLQDAMSVFSLLSARLTGRNCPYHAVFDALQDMAGTPENLAAIQQQVATEQEDLTWSAIDAIWEEEAVSFGGIGNQCNHQNSELHPVHIKPRGEHQQAGKYTPFHSDTG